MFFQLENWLFSLTFLVDLRLAPPAAPFFPSSFWARALLASRFAFCVLRLDIWGAGAAGFAVAFSRPRLGVCASNFASACFGSGFARGVRVLGFRFWGSGLG